MKKFTRQKMILDLMENYEIETQEELLNLLLERDINITQATISRDIKELRLVKVLVSEGKYKYATIDSQHKMINQRLIEILKASVITVEKAENLIVIRTIPETAQVCASTIEKYKIEGVIGTISGNDTIFVAIKEVNMIDSILESIVKLLK
ncbi:arginine repressor [Schnuerera sp. xch1]|uniref:arginine repressor n=1 Tax=Schnuerera sp. xch1 TaxID=2874283 RepID=UPI001CBEA3D6|nr:arginine repressor [Schnuerera sp. xch1]MBZ2173760.1 arginine repressor [Schnuerera sp. xch1]